MKKSIMKKSPLIKILNNSLIDLPTPLNISSWWNIGSLLGLCLMIQMFTGLLLSMNYTSNITHAFDSIIQICRNINYGWLMRAIHTNGTSLFFICMYIHIGRGIYYNSYLLMKTWIMGTLIFIMSMTTAFLGYVLPWGQMSFWGATVITNLLSAIPYMGNTIIQWLWGSFSIDNATLTRFFIFHFSLPFIISATVMIHLLFLHQMGSNNPMGMNSNMDKISFHPFYSFKDITMFLIMLMFMLILTLMNPYFTMDPDNFIPANPLVTPTHIQPEWYFLFAYAILRSVPNKLGGVIALISSITILLLLPFINKKNIKSNTFYPINKILYWIFIMTILMLTWIGANPVEIPFIKTSQLLTTMYFLFYPMNTFLYKYWDNLIFMN